MGLAYLLSSIFTANYLTVDRRAEAVNSLNTAKQYGSRQDVDAAILRCQEAGVVLRQPGTRH